MAWDPEEGLLIDLYGRPTGTLASRRGSGCWLRECVGTPVRW